MGPEQIVRALAAADPTYDDREGNVGCSLCGAGVGAYEPSGRELVHTDDCPWRLAVEWVEGHSESTAVMVDAMAVGDEQARRGALARFGPQFDVPAGMTVTAVYAHGGGGGASIAVSIDLAEPVTGPGWFFFDAESRRLVPYPPPAIVADCAGPCDITRIDGPSEYACTRRSGEARCRSCPEQGASYEPDIQTGLGPPPPPGGTIEG